MKKQTKLVAVLSTAALLAVGASMTSFAAQGWQDENGTWVYYQKDGDKATEKWAKSGENWFYLDENGEMATDKIVEDGDQYYYLDQNGAMVANKWISVENDEYTGDDEDEPANYWYYFGSNGKAYKKSSSSSSASFKVINGKKYLFNEEGKMLYGWVNKDGERQTGKDAWRTNGEDGGIYYLGDENDGAQAIGWRELDIEDDQYDSNAEEGASSKNVFDDENQRRWFYFNTNGKKYYDKDGKTINGQKYSFDEDGRMNVEWVYYHATNSVSTAPTTATGSGYQGDPRYTNGWRWFGDAESGARKTKGWFQVVPDENLHEGKYNDDEDAWYYGDKDGKLLASEIKTINSKKYLFNEFGRMESGLKFVSFNGTSHTKVNEILADDNDNKPFDTEDNFKKNANDLLVDYSCYYFGNGDDGSMKTGKQKVTIDGDSFDFLFIKSGSSKGVGKTGVDNKKYYLAGMLLKADKDDKYAVIKITDGKKYELLTTEDFLADAEKEGYITPDGIPTKHADKWSEYYKLDTDKAKNDDKVEYKLVNTSGTIQKNKTKAKDGADYSYKLSGEKIDYVFVDEK